MNDQRLDELQLKLGYDFIDTGLLTAALTHSSFIYQNNSKDDSSNERLEFLGDSILGMTTAALIYHNKPLLTEGQMTKLRAELVCEKSLADIAAGLELGKYLILGYGEDKGGGRERPSILADAFEAVLAAMYLDGGFKPVENLIAGLFSSRMEGTGFIISDFKTAFQEFIQKKAVKDKKELTISYRTTDEHGPDHDKLFTVEVCLNGETIGTGTGRSKKAAEQAAAKAGIDLLTES